MHTASCASATGVAQRNERSDGQKENREGEERGWISAASSRRDADGVNNKYTRVASVREARGWSFIFICATHHNFSFHIFAPRPNSLHILPTIIFVYIQYLRR